MKKAPLLTLPSRHPSMTPGVHDRVAPSGLTGSGSTSLAFERVYSGNRLLAGVSVNHLVMTGLSTNGFVKIGDAAPAGSSLDDGDGTS